MTTAQPPLDEWADLPWRRIERQVTKLQTRIYRAAQRDDVKTVHRLQRLLLTSWSARCLAVRRVTQDNRGKRTAGIDGVTALTPQSRMRLVQTLTLPAKALPTRRVWIPKPGSDKLRPLSIPTMQDRAAQALVKLALEPEWEARFEPNSYGFRPGRSTHDAIGAVVSFISRKPKYVLDADLEQCFDRIDHQALLEKLDAPPMMRQAIKAWLRAGVLDGGVFTPTEAGTPQGGVISPLLANIALHGMERALQEHFPRQRVALIRYADDLVILHHEEATIFAAQDVLAAWLEPLGLRLNEAKTRIVHTLERYDGQPPGFDFLGVQIQQHRVGRTHSGKNSHGQLLGFKTVVKPSHAAQRRHQRKLRQIFRSHQAAPQAGLIARLNPVIRGWTNYYAPHMSRQTFKRMDEYLWRQQVHWVNRRHPGKSTKWKRQRYWTAKWHFRDSASGAVLRHHADTRIRRHIKVRGASSPFDGNARYWKRRLRESSGLPRRVRELLRRQHGSCWKCGRQFRPEDVLEVDHIRPRSQGGDDRWTNLQLLHRHCHDQKTARDMVGGGIDDNDQASEEPDDVKVSRPVLKTSRSGDWSA